MRRVRTDVWDSVSYSASAGSPFTWTVSAPYAVSSRTWESSSSPIRTASTVVPVCSARSLARQEAPG